MRTIFNPSNSYQVLHSIEEEVEVTTAQTIVKKTNGSLNKDTQQSIEIGTLNKTQEEHDEGNVDTLLKIPKVTINVFGTFDWVTKKGWPQIPRKRSEEDVTKKLAIATQLMKLLEEIIQTIPSKP